MRLLAGLLLLGCLLSAASAATYYLSPSNSTWPATIQGLKAGDTAIFAAGQYTLNQYYEVNLHGTSGSRIVVKGAGAGVTVITQQRTDQNIINVAGEFFSFYNMTFTGGSRGVRLHSSSSDVTFDGVNIQYTQETAFSANDHTMVYTRLTLRNMEVHHAAEAGTSSTGECFYLGCQDNLCQVTSSLVELNYCHDTVGAMDGYGSGIQLKTGSYNNIIRDNVLYNTQAPGILLYDDYKQGTNVVEGNVVITTQDAGIQVTSGVIVRNNIVIGAKGYGIYVSNNQIQSDYHNIQIAHNTVYSSGSADLYLPALSTNQFAIVNNAFLTSGKAFAVQTQTNTLWLKNAYVSGTVPSGVSSGGVFQVTTNDVIDVAGNNFYPTTASLLINAGSPNYTPRLTYDFNGTPRSSSTPTVGAYEYTTSTNPTGPVGAHFKSQASSSTNPPNSGGGSKTSGASGLCSWLTSVLDLYNC